IGNRFVGLRIRINEIGRVSERLSIELHRRAALGAAVKVEDNVLWISPKQSPAHINLAVHLPDGDHAAAKVLHLPLPCFGAAQEQQSEANESCGKPAETRCEFIYHFTLSISDRKPAERLQV